MQTSALRELFLSTVSVVQTWLFAPILKYGWTCLCRSLIALTAVRRFCLIPMKQFFDYLTSQLVRWTALFVDRRSLLHLLTIQNTVLPVDLTDLSPAGVDVISSLANWMKRSNILIKLFLSETCHNRSNYWQEAVGIEIHLLFIWMDVAPLLSVLVNSIFICSISLCCLFTAHL